MARCPNCGQETKRTEDWSCQWCGYPLLSGSYKKIPKTYRELKEERLSEQLVVEEAESEPETTPGLEPELEVVSEPEAIPEPEPVSEPEAIPEPEPVLEPEVEVVPEAIAESVSKPEPKIKRRPAAKSKAAPKSKPSTRAKSTTRRKTAKKPESAPEVESEQVTEIETEPVLEAENAPVPEVEPETVAAAIELTVEELLSAYEGGAEAADARFTNQILKITGLVDRIEVKTALDIYYITLNSAEQNRLFQGVRCVFNRQNGPELEKLTAGQTVTVQGKYVGSMIDISMRDCVLVP